MAPDTVTRRMKSRTINEEVRLMKESGSMQNVKPVASSGDGTNKLIRDLKTKLNDHRMETRSSAKTVQLLSPPESLTPRKRRRPLTNETIEPTKTFSKEQYDDIKKQIDNTVLRFCSPDLVDKCRTMAALGDIAIKLDIEELEEGSEDVPGLFKTYMEVICLNLTEEDEEFILDLLEGRHKTFLHRIEYLTGRDKEHSDEYVRMRSIYSDGDTPWRCLSGIQDRFDTGKQFFNCENFIPYIQATLDGLALSANEKQRREHFDQIVEVIKKIASHSKARTIFKTQQSALKAFTYIIEATERCDEQLKEYCSKRCQDSKWYLLTLTDQTQLAIMKLLAPHRMDETRRSSWQSDPNLLDWLAAMTEQGAKCHLPGIKAVVYQFDLSAVRSAGGTPMQVIQRQPVKMLTG